jgi:hypothetical protein
MEKATSHAANVCTRPVKGIGKRLDATDLNCGMNFKIYSRVRLNPESYERALICTI